MSEESSEEDDYRVEAILVALALQVTGAAKPGWLPRVVEHLAAQSRPALRGLLRSIGHLIHYGSGSDVPGVDDALAVLFEDVVRELRRKADQSSAFAPGDRVAMVIDLPGHGLRIGDEMRVLGVGVDGTADIGSPNPMDDYEITTVASTAIRAVDISTESPN